METLYAADAMPDRRKEPVPIPNDRRSSNRRAFPRWATEFEVRFRVGSKTVVAKPVEIGEGGLSFQTDEPLKRESEIVVEYLLQGEKDWVTVKGIVRHVDNTKIGVEFLNLRRADRLKLVDFVTATQK